MPAKLTGYLLLPASPCGEDSLVRERIEWAPPKLNASLATGCWTSYGSARSAPHIVYGSIPAKEKTMTASAMRRRTLVLVLGASVLLLSGCVSAPGTYPDPNGPRDAKGRLVDPQTGLLLPGQGEDGI
jgi:hypothetical protein